MPCGRQSARECGKPTSYGYHFRDLMTGARYRKIVPLARTKWDAERAEIAAKKELFEKRFGVEEKGTVLFSEFARTSCLFWTKGPSEQGHNLADR